MTNSFGNLTDELPAERRKRIRAHTEALVAENLLLKSLRKDCEVSQEVLAIIMGIRQASLSKIENQDDILVSTLRRYVEALGGELEVTARFDDREVKLNQF